MKELVNLDAVLQTHILERPLCYAGATVTVSVDDEAGKDAACRMLSPLIDPYNRWNWKVRRREDPIPPIYLVVETRETGDRTEPIIDFRIESLNEVVDCFGKQNVRVEMLEG